MQRGEAAPTIEDAKQAFSLARARRKALGSRSAWIVPIVLTAIPVAKRAESENRALLVHAGESPDDIEPRFPPPTVLQIAADSAVRFGLYCAIYGALAARIDGDELSAANMWDRGWIFAAIMTVVSLAVFERRQTR